MRSGPLAGLAGVCALGIGASAWAQGPPPDGAVGPSQPGPPAGFVLTEAEWVATPGPEDIAAVVREARVVSADGGRAVIDCAVTVEGALADCRVAEETPGGRGYGPAALGLSGKFRMLVTETVATGVARIRVPVRFELLGPAGDEALGGGGAGFGSAPAAEVVEVVDDASEDAAPTLPPPSPHVERGVLPRLARPAGP